MIGGLCVALPLGRLYGILNIKWLYLSSVVLFMAGSALCGGAPNMPAMIVGRVIAGVGGNGMNTGVNTLYSMNTTEKERPMYMALM
jgi:MFS family permease